jgi:hypothetical protein
VRYAFGCAGKPQFDPGLVPGIDRLREKSAISPACLPRAAAPHHSAEYSRPFYGAAI